MRTNSHDVRHRERLVHHVQELERLAAERDAATEELRAGFAVAQSDGYDPTTLKVVLKLRKMTPSQRRERRALEAIYLAALGMLEGDPLPDEARRRLDEPRPEQEHLAQPPSEPAVARPVPAPAPPPPVQPPLILKDPAEAKQEGAAAAAAGKRVYDNPYPAGDPCRAAWDEGWCSQANSHGMDTPAAYQRRSAKPPESKDKPDKSSDAGEDAGQGAP